MSNYYKHRFEAVFLVSHPKGPKLSFSEAAKYLKKSKSFVQTWNKRYLEAGNVDDYHKKDRPRVTSKKDDKAIESIFLQNPTISIRQAHEKLARKGIKISFSTIQRRLKEFRLKKTSTVEKPLLTKSHVERRLTWAKENIDRDWSNVVFTDESTFLVNNPVRRAWTKNGERYVERTVKHPAKVHVYGSFCYHGFGRLICFTGNLDAERMLQLYKKGLLQSTDRWFGCGNREWVLQEDNDPKHRSSLCSEWKREHQINVMNWPAQSPDCNPIENVWGLMKQKLRGKKIKNTQHLIRILRKLWKGLSREYAQNLVNSCQDRCKRVINSNGDWTTF